MINRQIGTRSLQQNTALESDGHVIFMSEHKKVTSKGEAQTENRERERREMEMEQRCVHCGFGIKTLFVQYSPGNIRLMKCEYCKEVADEYIECEIMILLIDLILLKRKAYRHLLCNMMNRETFDAEGILWKASFLFLILDACRTLVLNRNQEDHCFSSSSFSSAWVCGKILMNVLVGNLIFFYVLIVATRLLLGSSSKQTRYRDFLLAILVSSYFKNFLIAMMVWEFPSSAIFIIDGFVLSSNAVSLEVMTEATTIRCLGVCFSAHAMKFLASQMLEALLSTPLRYFSIFNC